MIREALLLGAGTGTGLTLVLLGLRPNRPALVDVLDGLRRPAPPPMTARQRRYQVLGAPLVRLGLPTAQTRTDLAVLQKDVPTFLAEQAAAIGLGVLALPVLAALWGVGGLVPLWLAGLGGLIGYRWAVTRVRAQAERRRAQLRHTLSVMLDLVTISLAGGAGVEQALDDAASVCTGWAADQLRAALRTARLTRQPPWRPLGQLGLDTGVNELAELAATMQLAGAEGARVRASLAARASGMRARTTAAVESAARSAGVRMSLPVMLIAVGYGLFLLYPAIAAIRTGL
ncbi:type II secretion system F family protein [Micromonospora arborensis]|uniref:type II secretion system F family protein n=1 Tax=Micromonospora arborensis TaxID=2116518 RepID=UPI0033C50150